MEFNDYNFPSGRIIAKCGKCSAIRNILLAGSECAVCIAREEHRAVMALRVRRPNPQKSKVMKRYWKEKNSLVA